jgi:hypothetical protein
MAGTIVKKAWGDMSDDEEYDSPPNPPSVTSSRGKGNSQKGNSHQQKKNSQKGNSHQQGGTRRSYPVRESREDCFERRGELVLSFLDKKPFSVLHDVHAYLLAHEESINHQFLPSVQSVHASLFQMMNSGKAQSRILPGVVQWARIGAVPLD